MKAIIVTGGKQYTVSEGDVLYIEKLNAEEESVVTFDQVLAVLDGEASKIGAPVVEGAVVEGKVVKNGFCMLSTSKGSQRLLPVTSLKKSFLLPLAQKLANRILRSLL